MDKYFRPISISLLFLIMQFVALSIIVIGLLLFDAESFLQHSQTDVFDLLLQRISEPIYSVSAVVISSIFSVLLLIYFGSINLHEAFDSKNINFRTSWKAVLGAILAIFIVDAIVTLLHIPDLLQADFQLLSHTWYGIVAIGLFGPIVEELIFRHSIIRVMINYGANDKQAVIYSALCFGLVHFNPAQIVFAFCLGVVLGMIYVKQRNILLTSLIHIINNSLSLCLMNFPELEFLDMGNFPIYVPCIVLLILSYPSYKLLATFIRMD